MKELKVLPTDNVGSQSVPPNRAPAAEQPRWRRDFPIDWQQDEFVSRRDLTKFVVLTSGGFAVGQLWILLKSWLRPRALPASAVAVAAVDELEVGGAKVFSYPAESSPRLLVRTGPETFVAYDQQCTHLQCPVVPAVESGRLHCPCHNGWFDLQTGVPLAGPPRRPLAKVLLEVREGTVYAVGMQEST